MPVITIYLNQQLWEFIKNDKSRIIQQAIKELMDKRLASPVCTHQAPSKQPDFQITNTTGKSG
jgi:hypothetical protein